MTPTKKSAYFVFFLATAVRGLRSQVLAVNSLESAQLISLNSVRSLASTASRSSSSKQSTVVAGAFSTTLR